MTLHVPRSAASIVIKYILGAFCSFFSLWEIFFFQIGRTEPPKPGQIASGGDQSGGSRWRYHNGTDPLISVGIRIFFFSKKVELPDFSVLVVASKAGTAAGNW